MAGEKNTVQVTVTAKDEATGTLTQFIRQLDSMGREGQKAGAGIRNLAAPLAFELAPALGTTGGAIARLVGSVATMGTGFASLALAATGLAGILAGPMLDAWKKSREEAEKWKLAFSAGDVGKMTAAIDTQIAAVRKLGEAYRDAEKEAQNLTARRETGAPLPLGLLGRTRDRARLGQQELEAETADIARKIFLRDIRDPNRDVGEYGAPGAPSVADQQETARLALVLQLERAHRGGALYDFTLDPLTAETRQRQRQAAEYRLGGATDAAGRLLGTIPTLRNFTRAGQLFNAPLSEEFLGFEQISDPTMNLAAQAAVTAGRDERLRRDAQRYEEQTRGEFAFELGGGAEAIGVGPTPEEIAKGAKARNERLVEARDIDRERAQIATEYIGLTNQQRDVLALQVIEATKLRDIEAAGGNERLKDLAEARAELEKFNLELRRSQREDALAGLAAGFRDVADEAEQAGANMRRFAQTTARAMQQSFSDLFFNVMTGNFKSLEDVGKNFGLSVARALSDSLAQSVSSPILGLLRGGSASLVGAAPSFFGSAAQGGLTQEQIVAYQASGGTVTGGQMGLLGGLSLGGLLGGGSSLPSSYGADSEFGSPGSAETTGGNIGGGGGGYGISAGGIASLALLAASIGYGASQKGGTPSGQSRALGGALTGASIGGAIWPGYGHAIGAVVGLFAGVATADAKDRNAAEARHRGDAYNVGRFQPRLQNDIAQIQAAQNYQELAVAVRDAMHEAYGGRSPGTKDGLAGFACWIAGGQIILPGGSYPTTMTLDDLAGLLETDGDSFTAQLQLGVAEHVRRQLAQIFEQAVKDQAALIGRFNATPFAYEDVGPGIRRTTILPAGALATADVSGHALMVDRAAAASLGLTDAQMDNFIRQFADRNTQTDRIPDFTAELRLQL